MLNPIHNTTFTESFWSHDDAIPYVSDQNRAHALRSHMLQALELAGVRVAPVLMHRLQQAQDVADLWFLRIDIMQELSMRLSEEAARSTMGTITALFVGHMPDSVFTPSQYAIRTQNVADGVDSSYFESRFGNTRISAAGPSNPAPPAARSTLPPGR